MLKSSDVLLEVIDARDPMGCRCLPLAALVLVATFLRPQIIPLH